MDDNFNIIKVGVTNCYLLKSDSGAILVDTGYKGKTKIILDFLQNNQINPKSILLIILTHAHYDHIGNASEIKKISGAKILLHKDDLKILKSGLTDSQSTKPLNIWGKFLLSKVSSIDTKFNTFKPDIVIDSEYDLSKHGIKGRIVPTPGHSDGSISIILDSGEALIGDLAMNGPPLRLGAGEPIFGENMDQIYQSWKKLIEMGVTDLYPSHGSPFKIKILKNKLRRKGFL